MTVGDKPFAIGDVVGYAGHTLPGWNVYVVVSDYGNGGYEIRLENGREDEVAPDDRWIEVTSAQLTRLRRP